MNRQDFIKSINNYQNLSIEEQKKVNNFCYTLMDNLNHLDEEKMGYDSLDESIYREDLMLYIEKVIKPMINNSSNIQCLFNPLIIKASMNEKHFNELIKPLIGLECNEFLAKIKYGNVAKDARKNYADENIKIIDHFNPLESNFCERYFSYLMSEKQELSISEKIWVINYLSYQRASKLNIDIDLNISSLKLYMEKEKISLLKPKSLVKINNFLKVLGNVQTKYLENKDNEYVVSINPLGICFTKLNIKKEKILPEIISTCFHEMRHVQQQEIIKQNKNPNYDELLWAREYLIYHENEGYYKRNYTGMAIEMDARIEGINQSLKTLKRYAPELYESKENLMHQKLEKEIELKKTRMHFNGKRMLYFEDATKKEADEIIKNNPGYLKRFPTLQREYNMDGTRKDIETLIKDEKHYKEEIKSLNNELYSETISDDDFKLAQKILNNALNNSMKLYDELIYLSITEKDDKDVVDICNKLYINDIKRVRSAVETKIIDSVNKKNIALEHRSLGYLSSMNWFGCDKYFSNRYTDGYNKKELLSNIINKRETLLVPNNEVRSR
ncbi:MAG: hypothetical protein PHO63_04510 [Bacilli bacterium]|nr:hypothetical protein [Bacilli bacterium]MDD4808660.1 hypothetical protein [Bacilli bacterium]